MHPILFSIARFSLFGREFGPLHIFSYGAMLALAFLLSIALAAREAKKAGFSADDILDVSVYIIISSIIVSRIFYVITGWSEYSGHGLDALKVYQGGLSFHGGVVGGMLAVVYFCRRKKYSLPKLMDTMAPSLAMGLALGRIGCFLNGCCFGRPTYSTWGFVFPSLGDGLLRHPAQLYDSAMNFTIALLLVFPLKRFKRKDGDLVAFWFILSGVTRFIMEIFRAGQSSVVTWPGITIAQWVCIAMVAVGVALYLIKPPAPKPAAAIKPAKSVKKRKK